METEDNHESRCHCQDCLPKICLYHSQKVFELVSECAADPYLAADRKTTAIVRWVRHMLVHIIKQRLASNTIYKFHRWGESSKGKNFSVTSRYFKNPLVVN
jgi:hypothetical protein